MDSLAAVFTRYQEQAPQEKLFAHVDRTFYLAGETIWFKLYDIDGRSNRPAAISGVAYVEVLDRDQRPILQAKVEIKNGKGDGSLSIPLSVASGGFVFRAYTSWMKNFSPEFYYMQPLTIFNTLNDAGTDTTPVVQTSHAADTLRTSIRIYPEGGNLVNGVGSLVAVEVIDRNGQGARCSGAIMDQHGDTVVRFYTGREGIGRFTFTPAAGHTYIATTEVDQRPVTQPLPAAYDQGYVMHLETGDDRRVRITVHASGQIGVPLVYLLAHTRGQLKAVRMSFVANGVASFDLTRDSLGDGISHLTVFNADRVPVCERLYFKSPKQQLHIGVTTGATGYPTRSRVSIDLSTADNAGNPLPADLSLSVFQLDSLQSVSGGNILTWLMLRSDLKGRIRLPLTNDWATDSAAAGTLDDLMLTQGWSRFRWEEILQRRKPSFEFLPETNGLVVNAKVVDRRTGQAPHPVIGYLSLPGRHFVLATALSQPDGNCWFHLDNFHGIRTLITQTNSQTDSNCRMEVASPWSERFAPYPLPFPDSPSRWSSQLLQRSIDAQAENAYLRAIKHRVDAATDDTVAFYGSADLKYDLDDYVRFVTMEEVIQEFVENVHVRRRSGHTYFRVKNALFNLFFEDDPLLLLDGIPVFNADKLVVTDPAKIEKIEVVSHKYILGPSVTDGLVSFRSYDGEFAGYELDPNAVAVQFSGLDQHREFYTPVYSSDNKGQPSIPDLRNELLWAPDIVVGAAGRQTVPLYTSDVNGKFALVVQGITPDGVAGYSVVTFSVGR